MLALKIGFKELQQYLIWYTWSGAWGQGQGQPGSALLVLCQQSGCLRDNCIYMPVRAVVTMTTVSRACNGGGTLPVHPGPLYSSIGCVITEILLLYYPHVSARESLIYMFGQGILGAWFSGWLLCLIKLVFQSRYFIWIPICIIFQSTTWFRCAVVRESSRVDNARASFCLICFDPCFWCMNSS